jgi:catalase
VATPSTGMHDQNQKLHTQIVDTLNSIFGSYPGYRTVHAKGVVCDATFTPSSSAASLSRAPHFQGTPVPATLRFSNSTGVPMISDGDPNASPHGLGIKFHLPSGTDSDIVAHSFNGFPVASAEEFLEMFRAIAATRPDSPKPSPIEVFLSTHPRALAFVTTPKPNPVSFGALSYFAVNAFRFTNRDSAVQYARYQIHPLDGEAHITDAEAAAKPPNYLFDELSDRLSRGPAKLKLVAQLAAPGDPTNDATITWPDDRPQIELGVFSITNRVPDSDAAQKKLIFDPIRVADGIELSDDTLPIARSAVYSVSYSRRNP